MNRKRVLFLIESLSGGGAEKVLITLLKHFDKQRFIITLCCITRVGKYLDDIPSTLHFSYLLPDYKTLSGLALFLYKIKYNLINKLPAKWVYKLWIPKGNDVEIAFLEGSATRILSGSTSNKSKRIAWVHCDINRAKGLYNSRTEEISIYNRFDRIVTVSESSRIHFQRELPEVSTPVVVMYNPIDRKEIIHLSKLNNNVPDKISGTIRLISIGRLSPEKCYLRLLHIVRKLINQGVRTELWILGEGEEKYSLQRYIQTNGLSEYVVLWGFRSNPYAYLSKSDVFVCSSLFEGYSTAATEAIILGLPVITTSCSGMYELLENGKVGLITDNDEDALYAGIKDVLANNSMLHSFMDAASRRSHDFSLDDTMKKIESFIEGI